MMVDLFGSVADPLTEEMLCSWKGMLMQGRQDLRVIGAYRSHAEPMQIVSGKIHDPTIHIEAPPSARVPVEMARFVEWFNETGPESGSPLPVLTRAGMAHLYLSRSIRSKMAMEG